MKWSTRNDIDGFRIPNSHRSKYRYEALHGVDDRKKLLLVNLQVQHYGIVVKSTGHKLWRSDQQSVHGGSSPDQDTFILE